MSMTQKRLLIFFSVIFGISLVAFFVIKIAQGYKPDLGKRTLKPTGLLVATSIPDGAQVFVDGKLISATNNTLSLTPGTYEMEIKKDGYSSWKKNLTLEKELVTKTDAYLFSTYPNLEALTFTGAADPVLSPDGQHVAFSVATASASKRGLWVLDLTDRLLGLSREPRQILVSSRTRDFSLGSYKWSPDSRQIIVTLKTSPRLAENFLVESGQLNQATALVDITNTLAEVNQRWQEEENLREAARLSKVPKALLKTLEGNVKEITFSPDETKLFYTATASATIPDGIIPPLPASSTQVQSRKIEKGKIYVYDLKEDRNFYLMDEDKNKKLSWFPTSKHLFLVENEKINIVEYDGTNWVDAYSGPFENAFAFPFPQGTRILILLSLGRDTPPNLYAISLR